MEYRPLADEIRPETLEDVVGQQHILGEGGLLRRVVESGPVPNLIFYGPSGTGKTTVANIIAKRAGRTLRRLNATTASLGDVKDIIAQVGTLLAPNGILLYLDEIQYFNKKQQQSLLEVIESGDVTLIASTTENPYFYIYNAVLSRSSIFEFKPLTAQDVRPAIDRGFRAMEARLGAKLQVAPEAAEHIAWACGGDARKALNTVELLANAAVTRKGKALVTLDDAKLAAQGAAMRYDREGDDHFDIASALMKSLRGSDPDAALHYLARLLEAGDMITAIRRIVCSASEDVGMAYPQAALIVRALVDNALQVGLPEARLPLAQAVILLATAPKSNSVVSAIDVAMADVRAGHTGAIPRHLQNVHADTAGQEREQGYLYPHSFPGHWVEQQYLPDELVDTVYYRFGDNKTEQAAEAYWRKIKGEEE